MKFLFLILFTFTCYAQGRSEIDTVNGNYVSYYCIGKVGVLKVERLIYQDGKEYQKTILNCNINDMGLYCRSEYFPGGHKYKIEFLDPKTRKLMYLPLEFDMR